MTQCQRGGYSLTHAWPPAERCVREILERYWGHSPPSGALPNHRPQRRGDTLAQRAPRVSMYTSLSPVLLPAGSDRKAICQPPASRGNRTNPRRQHSRYKDEAVLECSVRRTGHVASWSILDHSYGSHGARYSRESSVTPLGQVLLPCGRNRKAREPVEDGY